MMSPSEKVPSKCYETDLNVLVSHFIAEKRIEKLRGLSKVMQLGDGRFETRSRLPTPSSLYSYLL